MSRRNDGCSLVSRCLIEDGCLSEEDSRLFLCAHMPIESNGIHVMYPKWRDRRFLYALVEGAVSLCQFNQ